MANDQERPAFRPTLSGSLGGPRRRGEVMLFAQLDPDSSDLEFELEPTAGARDGTPVTESKSPPPQPLHTQDDVELRLGADLENLPVIRSLAASMAIRMDFDLDAIADLKLAVDEAASTLITAARKATMMTCRFCLNGGELHFVGTVITEGGPELDRSTFGWQVLVTLTDAVRGEVFIEGDTQLTRIELVKRKPVCEA